MHTHLQQNGAPVRENDGEVDDMWHFLGGTAGKAQTTISNVLRKVVRKVRAVDFQKCYNSEDLATLFQAAVGYVSVGPAINPFIRATGGTAISFELKDRISQLDCEKLFREIGLHCPDAIQSTLALLSLKNDRITLGIRRLIVKSFESNEEHWNSWKSFSALSNSGELTTSQKLGAQLAFNEFWGVVDELFENCISLVQDLAGENEDEDPEGLLQQWRDIGSYFKYERSWEDIFERERILFGRIPMEISWATRQKYLMKILSRDEMGIPQNVIDLKLMELDSSSDYDNFIYHFKSICKIATVKGISFKGLKKSDQPLLKPKVSPVPELKKETPPLKQIIPGKWCQHHKSNGHNTSECREAAKIQQNKKAPAFGACFKCGSTDHWANECGSSHPVGVPQTAVRKAPGVPPVPPTHSAPPAASPSTPANPGTSRYGRPLRPTKPISLHTQVPEDIVVTDPVDQPGMPCVNVIVEGAVPGIPFKGLIDTGSNVSYISRGAFDKLQSLVNEPSPQFAIPQSFQVQTMNGTRPAPLQGTEITIAIEDSHGERSTFRSKRMIIHENSSIPGNYDFLLSYDWVTSQNLGIQGHPKGYEIFLPKSILVDSSTSTSDTNMCLHSIQFDAPEIIDDDDPFTESAPELANIVQGLPQKAVSMGPLPESDLISIKSRINDPPLKLLFDVSKLDPPVREYGFPAPLERQKKLFELLEVMEAQGVIRQVPRGTGLYVSPGYAVRKSGDRVRMVVKYCSLNDRLIAPAGVRHHSPVEWMHNLPSWATVYSVVDVKDAFYRVDVDETARPYLNTSVWSPDGCREYEWLKMPQGLSPSPSYWCALIESTIGSLIQYLEAHPTFRKLLSDARILVYVDDVLIAARDKRTCEILTDIVYQVLTYNKMYLPESKIQRCKESVEIMGLKLYNGSIYPNAETVDKVRNLKKPKDKSELLGVLGLLNYVRRSLPTQSDPCKTKIGRLYDLSNQSRFTWDQTHEEAWEELVIKFNEGLPIACFSIVPGVESVKDWTLVIQCDASLEYLGFVTMIIPRVSSELMDQPGSIDVTAYKESMRIINVGTKRLLHAERLYVPHDREALGIFWALESNRQLIYLFGEVVLQTDNKTALSRYKKGATEDASTTRGRRWVRWLSDLSDLLFCKSEGGRVGMVRFCHVQGKKNCFADYLSRYVLDDLKRCEVEVQTDNFDSPNIVLNTIAEHTDPVVIDSISPETDITDFRSLLSNWNTDATTEYVKQIPLHQIHQFLSGISLEVSPARKKIIEEVCVRRFSLTPDGCLLFHNNSNPVIVVPNVNLDDGFPIRVKLIQLYHEGTALSCHRAELATRSMLRKCFWWPSMDKDIGLWIGSCIPCISRKGQRFCGTFNPRKIQAPNQLLICDWLGPRKHSLAGYQYILVLVDAFSSFSVAIPYRTKSSENVADAILHWISLFGCPERWTSDNDTPFISETVSILRSLLGIRTDVAPTYSPTTQGSVERAVRTIKEGIEICLDANNADDEAPIDWPTLVKACIFNSNSIERHGGVSPFEVMLGRKPTDPFLSTFGAVEMVPAASHVEYVRKLRQHLATIHAYWSSKSMEIKNRAADNDCSGFFDELEPDDLCVRVSYISGRRMTHGTVTILSKIGTNTYLIRTNSGETVRCHGYQLLKVLKHPNRSSTTTTNILTHDADGNEYFEIEKILRYDPRQGYFVKWLNYSDEHNSWQRASDMPPSFRRQMASARSQFFAKRSDPTSGGVL